MLGQLLPPSAGALSTVRHHVDPGVRKLAVHPHVAHRQPQCPVIDGRRSPKNRDRLITDNIEGQGDADNGCFGKH